MLRNFAETGPQAKNQTKDQKFNSFLKDTQTFVEDRGKWRVVNEQLFRQVVYSFYEEAEFAQRELQQEQKSTQIRLTAQALREFSKKSASAACNLKTAQEESSALGLLSSPDQLLPQIGAFNKSLTPLVEQTSQSVAENSSSEMQMSSVSTHDVNNDHHISQSQRTHDETTNLL